MDQIVTQCEKLSLNINDKSVARHLDDSDPLKEYRSKFIVPQVTDPSTNTKRDGVYLLGNSLGLQPKSARSYIDEELKKWEDHGVEAYFVKKNSWYKYDEKCSVQLGELVGAKPSEVAIMASLTANLHFLMTSFYLPTATRFKILMEEGAFPADAVSRNQFSKLLTFTFISNFIVDCRTKSHKISEFITRRHFDLS